MGLNDVWRAAASTAGGNPNRVLFVKDSTDPSEATLFGLSCSAAGCVLRSSSWRTSKWQVTVLWKCWLRVSKNEAG